MGVKSTCTLTKAEAIELIRDFANYDVESIDNHLIADVCTAVSDALANGEGYTNYEIVD